MPAVKSYILRLSDARLSTLSDRLVIDGRFAQPVPEFEHSRQLPLVCLVLDGGGYVRYIAAGRRGVLAGTELRRLNLFEIHALSSPSHLPTLAEKVESRHRRRVLHRISDGGLLTTKQFLALVDAIRHSDGQLGRLLQRYTRERAARIRALPAHVREQLAYQKQALTTALALAGIDRSSLQEWDPPVATPVSFLDGLSQSHLREDVIVVNDLRTLPGFDLVRTNMQGSSVFESGDGRRLTVVLANRQPLEELTGTDLVYYNETFRSFVMVQYKCMETAGAGDAMFRLPNVQLDAEIARMEKMLRSVRGLAQQDQHAAFRLTWNPFFIKLCPRIVFEPDSVGLTPGMYFPLQQWKLLAASADVVGPRGGRGITFSNASRHLDNTSFIMLVANAWVGSAPNQSRIIEGAIRNTIREGRAALVAIRPAVSSAVGYTNLGHRSRRQLR